jgi:hypothetical protein
MNSQKGHFKNKKGRKMNEKSTTELPLTLRAMCRNGKIARLP